MKGSVWTNNLILESVKKEKLVPGEGYISGKPSLHSDYPAQP